MFLKVFLALVPILVVDSTLPVDRIDPAWEIQRGSTVVIRPYRIHTLEEPLKTLDTPIRLVGYTSMAEFAHEMLGFKGRAPSMSGEVSASER